MESGNTAKVVFEYCGGQNHSFISLKCHGMSRRRRRRRAAVVFTPQFRLSLLLVFSVESCSTHAHVVFCSWTISSWVSATEIAKTKQSERVRTRGYMCE